MAGLLSWIGFLGNRLLSPVGLQVRRADSVPPATLRASPFEAWSHIENGRPATFIADLSRCVVYNGFSFAENGWHPFVGAVSEHLEDPAQTYGGSILELYYSVWQPTDGRAALIGAPNGPDLLAGYPSYIVHAPWLRVGPENRLESISRIIAEENALLGEQGLTIEEGYGLQGPVSRRKGELEYSRLMGVLGSLQKDGYDRRLGDITAQLLVRGDDVRYRIVHGHHRVAVLAALEYSRVVLAPTMLVDVDDVKNWRQVREGHWSAAQALQYFHHHFDFDSRAWASDRGLA